MSREPDYLSVGGKVDRAIEASIPDGRYILRAIGLDERPGLTLQKLVRIISDTGTDKHDPGRRSVAHDEFSGYDYDIQAGPIEIRHFRLVVEPDEMFPTIFGGIAWHFYHGAPLDRGHWVRIDLLILYDPRMVVGARKFHPSVKGVRKGLDRFLYKFADPRNERDAVRGLVKVLRQAPPTGSARRPPPLRGMAPRGEEFSRSFERWQDRLGVLLRFWERVRSPDQVRKPRAHAATHHPVTRHCLGDFEPRVEPSSPAPVGRERLREPGHALHHRSCVLDPSA